MSWIKKIALFLPVIIGFIFVLSPDLRNKVRYYFTDQDRIILSVVSGNIFGDQSEAKVIKIKTPQGIALEIYKNNHLSHRLPLSEKKDGFFTFNGEATNLALDDMNDDGVAEIFVPVFDDQLVARLRIFRYVPEADYFELITR